MKKMREKKSSSATSLQSSVFFWRLASFLLSAWLLLTFYSWHILNSTHHANPLPATSVLDAATATDHVHTQSEVTSKAPPLKVEGAGKEDKHVLPSLEELATYANTNIKWKDCSTDGACMEQVLPQQKGDAVYSTSQMRVLHVLCPYPSSHEDVMQSQKMVMASIATAQHYWKQYGSHKSAMDVDVVAIEQWIHRDQRVAVPTAFYRSPYFLRLTAQDFLPETVNISKSLPILREILEIAYMLASRGDYTHVVFSNMDIAVMPFLYEDVHSMLACSSNFFINRVEIPVAKVKDVSSFHLQHAHEAQYSKPLTSLHSLTNLNLAYEYTLSFQQNHPGYDFMVLDTMALLDVSKSVGNVFTGYPPVGSVLTRAVNDLARVRSKPCKVITNMHSTFHVGSRNSDWGDVEAKEIINRNGDLVGSRNFTWSYLTPESKSMLRKHQSKLGMMKCSILKYSDRNHCFWTNPYLHDHKQDLNRYWFFEDRTHH